MIALLLAIGCSYPEETFQEELDQESCSWQTDCYGYQDYETCIAEAEASRSEVPDACTYDPEAARECVRDYAAIDCPDADEHDAAVPEACEMVWDCG